MTNYDLEVEDFIPADFFDEDNWDEWNRETEETDLESMREELIEKIARIKNPNIIIDINKYISQSIII